MHVTDSVFYMQVCMLLHWGPNLIVIKVKTAHVSVSGGISLLPYMCLSSIHSANYVVNSIVCAVIFIRVSRVLAYGIWPTHGPIHILDMHGTWNKHISRHSQKPVIQSGIDLRKFFWSVFGRSHMINDR